MHEQPPPCTACRYHGDRPCRPDGSFDADLVAAALLEWLHAGCRQPPDRGVLRRNRWARDCLDELAFHAPEEAFRVVLLAMIGLRTPAEAAALAGGPLEGLIAGHGARFIERIERLAADSPRFRFLLLGVWPQGRKGSPLWKRIEAARAGAVPVPPEGPLPEVGLLGALPG